MIIGLQAVTILTKKILLINSEPHLQEILHTCLTQLGGWQVLSVSSPLDGLLQADQEQPDAIVFDLSTFGMNFFSFLKRLRAQPTTQTIPVILVGTDTKWFDYNLFQEFQVAGIIEYPADLSSLPQTMTFLLHWPDDASQIQE